MIESVNNKKIKALAKLHLKKERDKTNLFIVEGQHMIEEAYKANVLKELFLLDGIDNPVSMPCEYCLQAVLNKLSNQNSDAKMIGICSKPEYVDDVFKQIIILDNVQDPGNVGTIIRSAYSFGMDAIYLSKGCADIYNSKTIQASQGALFHIPCIETDIETKLKELKTNNIKIYATALHTDCIELRKVCPETSFALIFGNEGQGIQEKYLNLSDQAIKIEMKNFESLNVAIAASICMYQFSK